MTEAPRNLSTLVEQFSDEQAAHKPVEGLRRPGGRVICPHRGAVGRAYQVQPRDSHRTTRPGNITHRRAWTCGACRQQCSVLVGTLVEAGRIPSSHGSGAGIARPFSRSDTGALAEGAALRA